MTPPVESARLKSCCANAYESDFAGRLLGDSFHPGGLYLTMRLGKLLDLYPGSRVLDVASGKGESAIFLAQRFGCQVTGVDFGKDNVAAASARATTAGVAHLVSFLQGDAEVLEFPDAGFDAVMCECAFCTFPDKPAAAREFARVLRGGGKAGLSDLTRSGPLPSQMEGLLAWIACIADARPAQEYMAYLEEAGLRVIAHEPRDEALAAMVRDIQGKLMGVEMMTRLGKLDLPGADFELARQFARAAAAAVRDGLLGYSLLVAEQRCS
jgi:ubiquinone/menaquinone biosynthesis C-methylase UbiE